MGWSQNLHTNIDGFTFSAWEFSSVSISSNRKQAGFKLRKDITSTIEPLNLLIPIYYYSPTKINFKKNKNYKFILEVSNYLQAPKGDEHFYNPSPLFMVTPLGEQTELLRQNTWIGDPRPSSNSDTTILPFPYIDESSINGQLSSDKPNKKGTFYGKQRRFLIYYYSNPKEDVYTYQLERPTTFWSSKYFGNKFTDDLAISRGGQTIKYTKTNEELLANYFINESDWLVQGYSYCSFVEVKDGGEKYNLSPSPMGATSGSLVGLGWYVDQNRFIWYDRNIAILDSTPYLYPTTFNYPVGGPWSGSPNIPIPSAIEYGNNGNINQGSPLNGTVKWPHEGFRKNNYIAKYVDITKFNFSFKYRNSKNDGTGIKIYLSPTLPSSRPYNSYSKISTNIKKILDYSTVTDKINISSSVTDDISASKNLTEIRVTINMKHTWVGDLILNLKSPNGNVINLFNRQRGNSDDFKDTIFSSNQKNPSIDNFSPPFTGTFRTNNLIGKGYAPYISNVNDIKYLKKTDGTILGDWILYIKDDAGLDLGVLENWSIEFLFDDTTKIDYLATFTQSKIDSNGLFSLTPYNFYGLEGNQYLIITADKLSDKISNDTTIVELIDLFIDGTYHPNNNRIYNVNNNPSVIVTNEGPLDKYGLTAAYAPIGYEASVGKGSTLNPKTLISSTVSAYMGNGRFKGGIWENGNWNSGIRDSSVYEFFTVDQFVSFNRDKKWRFSIIGPYQSVDKLNVGDKITISNIAGIDINDNRRLFTKYFTIIGKTYNSIIVEFEYDFPLKEVKIDSKFHMILVSKNIWLNGTFNNGLFNGIWNNGLFKGYPFITEMTNTHWIDGVFSGGSFHSSKISYEIEGISINDNNTLTFSFSSQHSISIGDTVDIIDYTNNNDYIFGETFITNVPNKYLIDTEFLLTPEREQFIQNINNSNKIGKVTLRKNTGLIQNIKMNTLNVSNVYSSTSFDSRRVFSYNTWMDLVYDDTTATNIMKPQSTLNNNGVSYYYNENNLYGYTTNDILSSDVIFRDSYSPSLRTYKLGTKYKIFNDYIGESSNFDDYFGENSKEFTDQGWVFSYTPYTSDLRLSRTIETSDNLKIKGKELKVVAENDGGLLNLKSSSFVVPNRSQDGVGIKTDINSYLPPNKYTMIEFDLVDSSIQYNDYELSTSSSSPLSRFKPVLHFGNINTVNKKLLYGNGFVNYTLPASYLPVYKNIDHAKTKSTKKVEYFFGKRNLNMYFSGSGSGGEYESEFIIDNLKFYEVNMIPFFKYLTDDNVNKSIQTPIFGTTQDFKLNSYLDNLIDSIKIPYRLNDEIKPLNIAPSYIFRNFSNSIEPSNIFSNFNNSRDF